jgi:hypothetical protein
MPLSTIMSGIALLAVGVAVLIALLGVFAPAFGPWRPVAIKAEAQPAE